MKILPFNNDAVRILTATDAALKSIKRAVPSTSPIQDAKNRIDATAVLSSKYIAELYGWCDKCASHFYKKSGVDVLCPECGGADYGQSPIGGPGVNAVDIARSLDRARAEIVRGVYACASADYALAA